MRLCSTSVAISSRSAPAIASAASSVNEPRKTDSRRNAACSSEVEQVVAPLDRRAQRPLALGQVARAAGEERERRVEPLQQRRRGEQPHPRGGELDRERQVVEATADLADGLVGRDLPAGRGRPAHEQLDRRVPRERLDGQLVLGRELERPARGREHDGLAHEQLGDDRLDAAQVLEVVEHEQHSPRGEPPREVGIGPQPDGVGDRRPHRAELAQRRERDEADAVWETRPRAPPPPERQARLAGPARAR